MMRMPGSWPSAATSCASPAVTVTKLGDLRTCGALLAGFAGYPPAEDFDYYYYCVQGHFEMLK